jgi:DNA-binding response OmpR family regulator
MPVQKILLIDYEPRSIRMLREPLERAGYSVHVAQDGLAGVDAFKKLEPDLVMIEAMLPKKNGFELCHDLKQTPRGRETPILIMSSVYKGRRYRTEALHKYGSDEFLEKPIAEEKLLETVRGFVGAAPTPAPAPAKAPQAAAAPPPPSPKPAATRSSAAPNPITDFAELEIIEKLDQLLPGDTPEKAAVPEPSPISARPEAEKVVSFDPERPRKRRGTQSTPTATLGGGSVSRGSAEAAALPHDEPATIAAAAASPQDDPLPEPAPTAGGNRGLWLGVIVGIIVVAAVAAYAVLAIP